MTSRAPGVIALFDVDGTLTVPRKTIDQEMVDFMDELKKHVCVGIVGACGSGEEVNTWEYNTTHVPLGASFLLRRRGESFSFPGWGWRG